jgi:hypothetical protein
VRQATSRSFGSAQLAQVDTSSNKSDKNIEDRDKGVEKWFEHSPPDAKSQRTSVPVRRCTKPTYESRNRDLEDHDLEVDPYESGQ